MNRKRKLVIFFFLPLLAFYFMSLVIEHHHDCEGENCSICMIIESRDENVKQLGIGTNDSTSLLLVFLLVLTMFHFFYKVLNKKIDTLVSMKVLLRN